MTRNPCIIIPFFGKWPKHFPLFLKSCWYNRFSIDYIIFSDIPTPQKTPENVRFIYFSLSDFNKLSSRKLQLDINITSPYKLCDFKPAYGFIFSDYIKGYRYWGHGDEDLILGELSSFISKPIEQKFDIISFRKEWLSGSFCLYKNIPEINKLFTESKSYPQIYQTQQHLAFDECFKLWEEIVKGKDILEIDNKQSMTYLIKKASNEKRLVTYFNSKIKESINDDNFLIFDQGKIKQKDNTAFLAYHFVSEKKSPVFTIPSWENIPDFFYINNTGFFTTSEWENGFKRRVIIGKRKMIGKMTYMGSLIKKIVKKIQYE